MIIFFHWLGLFNPTQIIMGSSVTKMMIMITATMVVVVAVVVALVVSSGQSQLCTKYSFISI